MKNKHLHILGYGTGNFAEAVYEASQQEGSDGDFVLLVISEALARSPWHFRGKEYVVSEDHKWLALDAIAACRKFRPDAQNLAVKAWPRAVKAWNMGKTGCYLRDPGLEYLLECEDFDGRCPNF
jgi:hypothetical protein